MQQHARSLLMQATGMAAPALAACYVVLRRRLSGTLSPGMSTLVCPACHQRQVPMAQLDDAFEMAACCVCPKALPALWLAKTAPGRWHHAADPSGEAGVQECTTALPQQSGWA